MTLPVSFLSDFGLDDEFVGVCHGVIARIAPDVRVIDITHGISPGDVRGGALALLRAVQYMPEGVALAVVDPGVGTARRGVVARTHWGYFVGPDNGVLAPAVAMVGGAERIVAIENPELRLPGGGETFHGRDLFAPAAAVIASGQAKLDEIGPEIDPTSVTPLMVALPEHEGTRVRGEVLWVDRFGNAQTNVAPADLVPLALSQGDMLRVRIGSVEHRMVWVTAYGDVDPGDALVHVDSYGQLAVAVRDGSAATELALAPRVSVEFHADPAAQIEIQKSAPAT